MNYYVVGFLFSHDEIALIRKERPEWQAGKLNGVGGHMDDGETGLEAMIREFKEEATDGRVVINNWIHFCTMSFEGVDVYYYRAASAKIELVSEDEQVDWYKLDDIINDDIIYDLLWLLQMADARCSEDWPYLVETKRNIGYDQNGPISDREGENNDS